MEAKDKSLNRRLLWVATPVFVGLLGSTLNLTNIVPYNNGSIIDLSTLWLECGVECAYRGIDTVSELSESLTSIGDFELRTHPQTLTKSVIRTMSVGLASGVNDEGGGRLADAVTTLFTVCLVVIADFIPA
jgi:hypothetical protein